jgi:hypothetical protein
MGDIFKLQAESPQLNAKAQSIIHIFLPGGFAAQETFDPYDENDNFNEAPFTEKQLVNVPFSIMATQSDVPSKEDGEGTRGSQVTKLATLDLMEAGVPIDYKGGIEFCNRLS